MLHVFIRRASGAIEGGAVINSEDLLVHLDRLDNMLIDGDVVVNAVR